MKDMTALSDGLLHLVFDAFTYPDPAKRVEAWRDAFSASVEVDVAPDEMADFSASAAFCPLGPAFLADTNYTSHTVVRDRRTIARTGVDQVILDVFIEGGIVGTVDAKPCRADAGDCFIMDMRGAFRLKLSRGRFIGFVMPRHAFDAARGSSAWLHGLILPAGSPGAMLLAAVMTSLADAAPSLPPTQSEAIGCAMIELVAACVGEPAKAREPHQTTRSSLARKSDPSLVRLRRHIERHASDPAYDPNVLAQAFGLSRSTLYRLFRPYGGLAEAIRERRAHLALNALSTKADSRRTLADIAKASGWVDVRSMKRALRVVFDATPEQLSKRMPTITPGTGDAGLRIGALFDDVPR